EEDWYNRTGLTDQSQARTTLHRTGFAAHHAVLLIRVFLWLAAYLPRMPLDCKETEDWLRPACSNMSAPLYVTTVEYPSPNR
uniref:IS4 family transposase n=1 Tax=Mesocestoides corti TaxID=53468 RepID=A0A5K3FCI6_MESCO